MRLQRLLRLAAAGLAVLATVPNVQAQKAIDPKMLVWGSIGNPIGGGLEGIADWSFSNAFADLMKQARRFGSADRPWEGSPPLDANGWPTGDFGVVLAIFNGMKNVGGTYKIRFECATTPTMQLVASPGQIVNVQRDAATGVVTADLVFPEGGSQIMIGFRNTAGGVRNLKVMRPGYGFDAVFTQPFLNMLKPLRTLRFMDWTRTNASSIVHWSDRNPPSAPSYAGSRGVPWEVCIDLCNLLRKDAHINVPHMATDDYVRQLAILFRDRLRPELKIYVEYSNEVWNWGFAQANWNLNQAKAEVQAGNSPLNFDGSTNETVWAARRVGLRLKQIADIFRQVQQNHARRDIRPVLGVQVAWPELWLVEPLKMLNAVYGPPANYLYAVGLAPYFNLGPDRDSYTLTVDQVLAALQRSVDAWKESRSLENCFTVAYSNGLKVVAYEGGPDTFGPGSIEAKALANLDPRMQPLCQEYLRLWFGYGGDMFNWFVVGATNYNTQYGAWGTTNDMTFPNSPKNLAIQAVQGAPKVPLDRGMVIPGDVDPRRWAFRPADWQSANDLRLESWDWRGPYREFLIRSTATQAYTVRFLARTATSNLKFRVRLANRVVGEVPVPVGAEEVWTTPFTVYIPEGMTAIRVDLVGNGSSTIKNIRVEATGLRVLKN
ncbi:MAG: hypothetical protein SNJ74_03650 [Fimbriimonadaceae bacterium]